MAMDPQGLGEDIPPSEMSSSSGSVLARLRAFFSGIRVRLLALVLLTLFPALLLMLHLARQHRDLITRDANDDALRMSRFVASALERDVRASRIFLSALSQERLQPGHDPAHCPDFVPSIDIKAELYDAVGVADSSGRILCQVPAASGSLDSSNWFRAARASGSFSVGYDLDHALIDNVTMVFAFPVSGPGGSMRALYYCALDLEWLNHLAERVALPQGAALTVTDGRGRTLVRYPHPELWVGKNFPDAPLSRSVRAREEGVVESEGIDGVVRLYAFSRVSDGGLSVRIGIPLETAYAEARAVMFHNLVALGAFGVLALAAAWAAGHWMVVRQVNRLVAATRSLAAGKLNARAGMGRNAGELGQLAQAFDEMAESLEWRGAQLRESESERSQSERRFSEFVEKAPDAILGVDGDFSLFFCNQGAEQMFGWPKEEMQGMDLGRLERGEGARETTLTACLRDSGKDRAEAVLMRRDGTFFKADVSVSRGLRNGRVTYTLIVRERGG